MLPPPSMMVVLSLSSVHALRCPTLQHDVLQFDPQFLAYDLTACEDRDVFEHRFATITESRCLYSRYTDRSAQFVDHQSCQRFALDVFRDNQDWSSQLGDLSRIGSRSLIEEIFFSLAK